VSLEIAPVSAVLDGSRAVQHLIAIAATREGATYDVTDRVAFSASDPRIIKIQEGLALPLADGDTRLVAKLGRLVSPPSGIAVRNSRAPASIEFVNDVMPIIARAGCNSTACHGSPVGKGGFKLSLFGYEPDADAGAITRDANGRRVDLKDPARSLLLLKATMAVPHSGGIRVKPNSSEYNTVLGWLKEGAPGIGEFEARVKQVEVFRTSR